MRLDDEDGDSAADSSKPINIRIPTFPPTAAVCAVRPPAEDPGLHRVNTVPMSLVARALLPPDDDGPARRRRGDGYVCSVCRRCDTVADGGSSQPATIHVTSEQRLFQTNAGVHVARKSPTQPNFALTRS